MTRRNFLLNLGKGLVAFNILPGAGRVWKAERKLMRFYAEERFGEWPERNYNILPIIYRREHHPLRFTLDAWNNLITESPKVWPANLGNTTT